MRRAGWHIVEDGATLIVSRAWPVRWDIAATAQFPDLRRLRLAMQIRQDLWRRLQNLRGFRPAVTVKRGPEGLTVTAGGAAMHPIPPGAKAQVAALLSDPAYRRRWQSPCEVSDMSQSFTISHADDSPFAGAGLRAFFEYRQLGIAEATGGAFGAHVIRAVPGRESPGEWHSHDLGFQMVYVTRGWVVFEYEAEGEHLLREGSCVLQPPGIRHREVRHSDDMELIEITAPAEFATAPEQAPDL